MDELQQQRERRMPFRRRRQDDRVAPLHRVDDVVGGRRGGVRRRRDRCDDADRARDFDQAARRIVRDDAHRPRAMQITQRGRSSCGDSWRSCRRRCQVRYRARRVRPARDCATARRSPTGGHHGLVGLRLRPAVGDGLRGARAFDQLANDGGRVSLLPDGRLHASILLTRPPWPCTSRDAVPAATVRRGGTDRQARA